MSAPPEPPSQPAERVSLTLAMIVRDESAVIERCLASVRHLLSGWVIVDTGSTDDTPERIEAALAGVPGRLHRREWVDFGTNRTQLMELARGVGTHLLLLDADMTVRTTGPLVVPGSEAVLLRHEGDPSYWIPRIVRADLPWSFVGPTHEHLSCAVPFRSERLDSLVIEHHADGGSRSDKLERDRCLLEAELARHPDDARSVFYLAQTLRDLGLGREAVELYRRRVRLGGWAEEVFYAQLQVGVLVARDDWFAAVPELLAAWEIRPERAEPLLELARGYRTRGAHRLARRFAAMGLEVAYPADDLLFVHPEAWEWALRFEHAIAAYHCGDVEGALADNDRLLADGVPSWVEPWVRYNRAWCLHALGAAEPPTHALLPALRGEPSPGLAELAPSTRFTLLDLPASDGWSTFNPSVAAAPDGALHVVLRSSNYRMGPGGTYDFTDPDDAAGVVRTVNRLVALDPMLRPTAPPRPVTTVPEGAPVWPSRVVGCEDLRLFHLDGRWRATATVRDRNPDERCEIALLDLGPVEVLGRDGAPADAGAEPTRLRILPGPDPRRHEKNWMPFVQGGVLHLLYTCTPTTVLRVAGDGPPSVVSEAAGPPALSDSRGGSQGLPVGDGFLFVVHEATAEGPLGRVYSHRLVHLAPRADGWSIVAMSRPFHLLEPNVEFCAGLAPHPTEAGRVVLSFGHADATAWLATAELSELLALLVPLGADPEPVSGSVGSPGRTWR